MVSDESRITLLKEYEDPASLLSMIGCVFGFFVCLFVFAMSVSEPNYVVLGASLMAGGCCVWMFKNALAVCKKYSNTVIVDTDQQQIEIVAYPRDYSRKKEAHILPFQDI